MRPLDISSLQMAYRNGDTNPTAVVGEIVDRCGHLKEHNIWISRLSWQQLLTYIDRLSELDPDNHPLWGIPFSIKDNIDLAGVDTTAACEAFRYQPQKSAVVVQRLIAAGAIPIGKTNLDQFATGLVGSRSPWGAGKNAFNKTNISGGSSSGSALAVALGLSSFSLGSDTAGSGRVPAAFNNLVGLKPSCGLLPATGMVPACRSLDCMSVFTLNTADANSVLSCVEGVDEDDSYSRQNPFKNSGRNYGRWQNPVVVGVLSPEDLEFFGDEAYANTYQQLLSSLSELGWQTVEIPFASFREAAQLLYEGPWVAERYLATLPLIDERPDALHEVTRNIISKGGEPKATQQFSAEYRLESLRKLAWRELEKCDCLMTPTAGRLFQIDEIESEPVKHNSQLGYYTNFMNLLDMSAVAVPAGFTSTNLPFGITLSHRAFSDRKLLSLANNLQQHLQLPMGAMNWPLPQDQSDVVIDTDTIELVVCGAHMLNLPLNWQLKERGAQFMAAEKTASCYRLFALPGGSVRRPALFRDEDSGVAIDAEIWKIPTEEFGGFVAEIPAPLGIGKVMMADGIERSGFISEPWPLAEAEEITKFGGWRNWLALEK